ncbi:MAG: hypothetical protein EOP05_19545, partial [Proteobacteria bacterium]
MNYAKLVVTVIATTGIFLQGCKSSESSGTSVGSADGETSTSTPTGPSPSPTPDAEPTPVPTPLPPTACLDAYGISRVEGAVWEADPAPSLAYVCPNPDDGEIPMIEEASYKCHDGVIARVVHKRIPNPEFVSCPQPKLVASVVAPSGSSSSGQAATSSIKIESGNLNALTYQCNNLVSGNASQSGSVAENGSFTPSAAEDLTCVIKGSATTGRTFEVSVTNITDCGNKIKVNGRCEDFACTSLVAIAPNANGILDVPVRSSNGKCYAYKLMDAIANSTS